MMASRCAQMSMIVELPVEGFTPSRLFRRASTSDSFCMGSGRGIGFGRGIPVMK